MHHDLSRCLNLLKTVKSDVVQVAGTVKVSLLVSHYLFEEAVSSSFSLFLLEE